MGTWSDPLIARVVGLRVETLNVWKRWGRERERERERERLRDRQTDRQRHRERQRQTDRQTDKDCEKAFLTQGQSCRLGNGRQTDMQKDNVFSRPVSRVGLVTQSERAEGGGGRGGRDTQTGSQAGGRQRDRDRDFEKTYLTPGQLCRLGSGETDRQRKRDAPSIV